MFIPICSAPVPANTANIANLLFHFDFDHAVFQFSAQ